ncbi:hypothetical protein PLICRDRAFT_52994 [Plicaturopsis crispa FD-325 SS-3]|nr:hypothetical protein PLICRDRAFT_52994 [Plicaturopsis crispa FD-325 SS-3]
MAGANYMGGKRNVAKARAKDGTSRLQKGHFSRQRLDILNKGLGGSRDALHSGNTQAGNALVPDIGLAHAQRHLSNTTNCGSPRHETHTQLPEITAMDQMHGRRDAGLVSKNTKKRTSKVLDTLDASERT